MTDNENYYTPCEDVKFAYLLTQIFGKIASEQDIKNLKATDIPPLPDDLVQYPCKDPLMELMNIELDIVQNAEKVTRQFMNEDGWDTLRNTEEILIDCLQHYDIDPFPEDIEKLNKYNAPSVAGMLSLTLSAPNMG